LHGLGQPGVVFCAVQVGVIDVGAFDVGAVPPELTGA
jgi:hypothetical protein